MWTNNTSLLAIFKYCVSTHATNSHILTAIIETMNTTTTKYLLTPGTKIGIL